MLTTYRRWVSLLLSTNRGGMQQNKNQVLPGTLNLMILKTLETLGPLHGYGIARRIEQISADRFQLNQGTIYPALLNLEQMGWISSKWGVSENNRRARYYSITRAGRKQLAAEEDNWRQISEILTRFIETSGGSL
jgi:PadR family transcriptional regulator, regulatory protein PadR